MIETTTKSTIVDKSTYINQMFSSIAKKYDLLNNLMTCGLHKRWKTKAIKLALKENNTPSSALDLCCGTGDLAIILHKECPNIKIECVDNCSEMLEIAKERTKNLKTISISLSDSENLTYKPSSFDLITIGFGLRNLVNKEKCIEDIYQLLTNNGVFMCIDLGHSSNYFWKKIFNGYFFNVIPKLGGIFAGNIEAYSYLPTSLTSWYKQEELKDLILKTGFKKCCFKNIMGGIVAIHIAVK